jgi:dTDP-glucose pyrophosphorylase
VLEARERIEDEEDLLIASGDTYVVSELGRHIRERAPLCRGLISVAAMPGDQWSFARVSADGQVEAVAEKERISEYASTGLYYFASGREFVEAATETMRQRETIRGEHYVMPLYQEYITRGWRVGIDVASAMWDMGSPDALDRFQDYLARSGNA